MRSKLALQAPQYSSRDRRTLCFANALIEESQYNAAGLLDQRCVGFIIDSCSKSNLVYDQYDSYGTSKTEETASPRSRKASSTTTYTD
ncbi:hypothetical protein [Microbulbifer discodermiae]|uniref:hypothetical protein n=1 Tax=Microbulbifer sp. 2201CG32-9 TaxID=3232309 RepID=UPI00345B542C